MSTDRAHARNTDPATSHEAADRVARIRETQKTVLDAFKTWGAMTDEQLCAVLPSMTPSGARSRRSELVERGLLRDSGDFALTKAKRRTTIWEVVT